MPMTGSAKVGSGPNGEFKIDVKASTDFEYDYTFIDTTPTGKGCFDVNMPYMADRFREYGRCVVVCDARVYDIYGESMRTYFQHHGMGPHATSHRLQRSTDFPNCYFQIEFDLLENLAIVTNGVQCIIVVLKA